MIETPTPHIDGQAITALKATPGGGYRVTHEGGVIHCPPGTRFAANIQAAIDAGIAVEPIETAEEVLKRLLGFVKQQAASRITGYLPEYKQRNLTARSAELLRIKSDRAWTVEETSEADAIQAKWDWVKQARKASDDIEADVIGGLITTEDTIRADTRWPV